MVGRPHCCFNYMAVLHWLAHVDVEGQLGANDWNGRAADEHTGGEGASLSQRANDIQSGQTLAINREVDVSLIRRPHCSFDCGNARLAHMCWRMLMWKGNLRNTTGIERPSRRGADRGKRQPVRADASYITWL